MMSKRSKLILILLAAILYVLLDLNYGLVHDHFDYSGFRLESTEWIQASSYLVIVAIFGLLLATSDGYWFFILYMIVVMLIFPTLIYLENNHVEVLMIGTQLVFFVTLFFISKINLNVRFSRPLDLKNETSLLRTIVYLSIGLSLFYIPNLPYIDLSNLLLLNVYDTRLNFREIGFSTLQGYLFTPLSRILLPISIILALKFKKRFLLIVSVSLLLFLFLNGALKSILFGLFAVLLFYSGSIYVKLKRFAVFLGSVFALSLYLHRMNGNYFLTDIIVRRIFFVPVWLDDIYHSHFSKNWTFWYQNPLGSAFTENPHGKPLTFYIGEDVIGSEGLNANVGLITEGYISAGFTGVVLHSLLIGLCFHIIRGNGYPNQFMGIIFLFIYVMNTSLISQFFTTHGFLVLILVAIYLFGSNKIQGKI